MTQPKFFVDECLSPVLAHRLAEAAYDAVPCRDMGRSGQLDHVVLERCVDEDRILVTHNAVDFRNLVGRVEMHPGLIILEENTREASWAQLQAAIEHINHEGRADPRSWMMNRVVEVDIELEVSSYLLPPV